jgi:hypothetical protein
LWCFPLVLLYYSNPGVVCYKILSAPGILKERIKMIILREKEFASTKESRKKSKELNEKDKTRKVINAAQGATAVGALGTAIGTGVATKKAAEKLEEQAAKKGVHLTYNAQGRTLVGPTTLKRVGAIDRLENRIIKNAKKGGKISLGLASASVGLGIAKHTRDTKKAKEEKKNK